MFDNGTYCYATNKPRSSNMTFKCGDQHKIIDIYEPTICSYIITIETPLACNPAFNKNGVKKLYEEYQQIDNNINRTKELHSNITNEG